MTLLNGKHYDKGVADWITLGPTIALFITGPGAIDACAHMKKGKEGSGELNNI